MLSCKYSFFLNDTVPGYTLLWYLLHHGRQENLYLQHTKLESTAKKIIIYYRENWYLPNNIDPDLSPRLSKEDTEKEYL